MIHVQSGDNDPVDSGGGLRSISAGSDAALAVGVKICGVNSAAAAAALPGASYAGFVFYPRSPRFVKAWQAASLAQSLPDGVARVGVFVDSGDDVISHVFEHLRLDVVQFHGEESPQRVASARRRFGASVMKALAVTRAADIERWRAYREAADMILFDGGGGGGTGSSFDWTLLTGRAPSMPWMLSGGLNAANLSQAVLLSGAAMVDVSSGVESRPGVKDTAKIRAFLAASRGGES